MSSQLVVARRTEADLREAFLWYEQRLTGLGQDFLTRVDAKFDSIAESPQLYRKRVGEYRLAATERFPYAIYFIRDEATNVVSVRRVLHFKQDSRPRI